MYVFVSMFIHFSTKRVYVKAIKLFTDVFLCVFFFKIVFLVMLDHILVSSVSSKYVLFITIRVEWTNH